MTEESKGKSSFPGIILEEKASKIRDTIKMIGENLGLEEVLFLQTEN